MKFLHEIWNAYLWIMTTPAREKKASILLPFSQIILFIITTTVTGLVSILLFGYIGYYVGLWVIILPIIVLFTIIVNQYRKYEQEEKNK